MTDTPQRKRPFTVVVREIRSYLVYADSPDEAREAWERGLSGDEGIQVEVRVEDVFASTIEPDDPEVPFF